MSYARICERWVDAVREGRYATGGGSSRVWFEGDTIYSYGTHFPMARVLRNDRKRPLMLVNGDRFSTSTSNHQNHVRHAISEGWADVDTIIIPFSAIRAASIEVSSIMPLEIKNERFEFSLVESNEPPADLKPHRGDGYLTYQGRKAFEVASDGTLERYLDRGVHPLSGVLVGETKGGESLWGQAVVLENGVYRWYTARHWMGDSVFQARVMGERHRSRWISSFDHQESTPLYFLSRLPSCRASTVDEALEALKPEVVKIGEAAGRSVTRQGDIFAVEVPSLDKRELRRMGAVFGRKKDGVPLIGTAHTATEVATLPDGSQFARGTMYHDPKIIGETWRESDHRRQRMGDGNTWHVIAKNTVPVQRENEGVRRAG